MQIHDNGELLVRFLKNRTHQDKRFVEARFKSVEELLRAVLAPARDVAEKDVEIFHEIDHHRNHLQQRSILLPHASFDCIELLAFIPTLHPALKALDLAS